MNQKSWVWILCIAVFGTLIYVQSISFDYTLDDPIYLEGNRVTRMGLEKWEELFKYGSMNFIEINPVNSGTYRPFTLLTIALERELVGDFDSRISHSVNLILYFSLLVVLGFLFHNLGMRRQLPWWIMALCLLLYAVHPVHVEVVASVKSRDTLLSSFLALMAILIWVRAKTNPSILHWSVILGLYFLSLISKEESITLLAFVSLIGYFFFGFGKRDSILKTLPFGVIALFYLILRAAILEDTPNTYATYINSVLYEANGIEFLATNLYVYLEYIKLLFFPHPLSWDYSFSQLRIQDFSNLAVWISLIFFSFLVFWAFKGFKERCLLSFGLIFYFSTFSIFANISSGLIIGSNMGERFLFLPSLSFCFLVVFGLYNLSLKIKNNAPYLFPALVLLPFLVGFTWKSFDRTKDWKNGFTITSQGAIASPNSWRTHALYGEELKKMGLELKKTNQDSSSKLLLLAKLEYESMLEIFEEKTPVFQYIGSYADVLWNLGDSTGALNMLEENVRINPKGFYALFQLGRLNFELKNYEIAVDYYLRTLKANNPNFGPTYRNLGLTYNRLNQKGNAVITLEKSLEYWDDPEIRRSVGFLYSELGAFEKAASFLIANEAKTPEEILFVNSILKGNNAFSKQNYRAAIPEYQKIVPIYDLVDGRSKFQTFYAVYAQSLIQTGDTVNSQKYFLLAANEIKSKDPVVFTNLGTIAFLKDKKFAQAEEYYQKAIDLDVKDKFNGYSNLGMTQLVQRKERDAMKSFEKALEYGQNKTLISNLFLLSKSLGETEKMKHYGDKLGIK